MPRNKSITSIDNRIKKVQEDLFKTKAREALQNPLLPSRMKQKCSVRIFRTASKNAVFLP